ncbi:hypothetical protein UFOVP860_50 [uncultured Caudovirales phage]|uniref:Uncharacterized protein n=1 Tax=uncultured Caudovirales phage TaxID=2100421 RepID=A0A6J5P7A6_9CAUD|nr:hypothetical protein UFOVP860_50 [uncultured Caudovirales phage]CAB4195842.1 hypothetical protein UFOVP1293_61 [uncultured Caudovirales phage]CAB4222604.1 hypothetical protein UFOVP1644_79 [uncultured Caudovirales phage]
MNVKCDHCGATYRDDERYTLCPHAPIMPAADLAQKDAGLDLLGKAVCFAHQPHGPARRVMVVGWNGMVMLQGMAGEFAPHLFVVKRPATERA